MFEECPSVFTIIGAKWDDGKVLIGKPMWRESTQDKMGYLYLKYRPACYWFEFVNIFRKIGLSLASIVFKNNPENIAITSAVIVAIAFLMQIWYKPYQQGAHKVSN